MNCVSILKRAAQQQQVRHSSAMVKAKKFIYVKKFDGEPNSSNFELVDEELSDELQDGEFLAKAEFLSVDPYMRPYMARYPLGVTMIGGQVAK